MAVPAPCAIRKESRDYQIGAARRRPWNKSAIVKMEPHCITPQKTYLPDNKDRFQVYITVFTAHRAAIDLSDSRRGRLIDYVRKLARLPHFALKTCSSKDRRCRAPDSRFCNAWACSPWGSLVSG